MNQEKFYQKTWFTILFLFLFFPIGLFTMWKYKKFNKVARIIITVLLCIGMIASYFGSESQDSSSVDSNDTTTTTEKKLTSAEKFAKKQKLSTKRGINYYNALKNIGIKPEEIDVKNKAENGMSFSYDDYSFESYFDGDKVKNLNSGDIYFIKNYKKVDTVKNRIVTTEERTWLISETKEKVKAVLKAPKTADFPGAIIDSDSWNINKNKKTYTVTSYVDAENSFGAQIRSEYTLTFKWNGDTDVQPELTSFIFDGEKVL